MKGVRISVNMSDELNKMESMIQSEEVLELVVGGASRKVVSKGVIIGAIAGLIIGTCVCGGLLTLSCMCMEKNPVALVKCALGLAASDDKDDFVGSALTFGVMPLILLITAFSGMVMGFCIQNRSKNKPSHINKPEFDVQR